MQAINFVKRMRRSIQEGTTSHWVSAVGNVIKMLILTKTNKHLLCVFFGYCLYVRLFSPSSPIDTLKYVFEDKLGQ